MHRLCPLSENRSPVRIDGQGLSATDTEDAKEMQMRRKHDAPQDEVEGIAQRLRSERPEASPLELDRIKTTALSRARSAAGGGRAGARRLAVAGLTVGLLLATTGGVLAGQGGEHSSGNAAVAQYGNDCDVNNGNGNGNGAGGNSNNIGNDNNGNCNENSFNSTTVNNTTNNFGGANTVNNYTTIAATPSAGVLGASTKKVTTSLRHIKIHVAVPRGAKVSRVMVKVNGRRLKVIKGRKASANVVLENLPCGKGATTIEVTVTLADGKTVTARHSYHLCA
jgi:hypothetical protein